MLKKAIENLKLVKEESYMSDLDLIRIQEKLSNRPLLEVARRWIELNKSNMKPIKVQWDSEED